MVHDDYYSQIQQGAQKDVHTESKPAKKILVKKKVKISNLKPTDASRSLDDASVENQDTLSEISQASTEESQKNDSGSLNELLENKPQKSGFKIISSSTVDSKKQKLETTQDSKVPTTNSNDSRSETPVKKFKSVAQPESTFKNKTVGVKSFDDWAKSKKPKFSSQSQGKKRIRNISELERDTFVRSNKVKPKKKEEKKIEDIEQNLKSKEGQVIQIDETLNLKEFSEKIGIPFSKLMGEFMKNGMMVNLNSQIDFDTASLIAETFGVTLEKKQSSQISLSDIALWDISELLREENISKLKERPPVVSIMWHVDHGKTSLLDYIRKESVASSEAGWITQSIGAYQVDYNDKKISFLDTPGHEAFTVMRARWAKSTDIAILVVAADEWVKPQTLESISHAREANITVIVAINKMDKEWANPDYVKGQLAENWLTPEDWGGETPMIPVSAHTWFWISELLEMILLVSEMQNLQANPERSVVWTVLESHLDPNLWAVATILVNTGTIQKWDAVVCWKSFWKIKLMKDYAWTSIVKALPGDPVLIVGLSEVVDGWDILQWVSTIDIAREKATAFWQYVLLQKKAWVSQLDLLMSKIQSWALQQLKIVLKADTNWSLEAIKNAILKLSTNETNVSVIHSWVWNITEWDILMCGWSSAILVWFWVGIGPNAKNALEETKVEFIESKIIYHITEKLEKIISWMYNPKDVEVPLCNAYVWGVFYDSKKFKIIGLQGIKEWESIENWAFVRISRDDTVVWTWKIESLKYWVEEVKKLEWPIECGIKVSWLPEILEKDSVEVYKITSV